MDKPVIIQIIRERQHPAFTVAFAFAQHSHSHSYPHPHPHPHPDSQSARQCKSTLFKWVPHELHLAVRPSNRRLYVCLAVWLPWLFVFVTLLCIFYALSLWRMHTGSQLFGSWRSISISASSSSIPYPQNPRHQVPLAAAVWHFCGGGCGGLCGGSFWFRFWFSFRTISGSHGPRLLITLG